MVERRIPDGQMFLLLGLFLFCFLGRVGNVYFHSTTFSWHVLQLIRYVVTLARMNFFILSLQPVTKKKENCDPRLPNIYTLWISFHLNSDEVFFKVRRWRLIERILIDCGCCNIRIKVSKRKVVSENSKQNRVNWPKPLTLRLNLQVSLLSTIQFL